MFEKYARKGELEHLKQLPQALGYESGGRFY